MPEGTVTILGTGDYGRALAKRLLSNNYEVICGSRRPGERNLAKIDESLSSVRIMTIEESLQQSEMILLAIPCDAFPSVKKYQGLFGGKTVVDISNWSTKPKQGSNAEQLQAILPDAHVVKAFNTISAYAIENDAAGERRVVYIAGENVKSRELVRQLVMNIHFEAVDCGGISHARQLEAKPHEFMKGWLVPTVVFGIVFALWIIYTTVYYYHILDFKFEPEQWPVKTLNKAMGCTSLTLLALCFMPSCLAAFAQLINGTKYKRFPNWLDTWLKMRKQIGYYSLLLAAMHAIMSLAIMSPANLRGWYQITSKMTWMGETAILLGVIAFTGLGIMGISSLPSVGSKLNWIEWRFFQSYLGWFTLLIATSHPTVIGGFTWEEYKMTAEEIAKITTFLCCLIPWLTLLMKIIIVLPGISCHLTNIRAGHDRGRTYEQLQNHAMVNGENVSQMEMSAGTLESKN